MFASARLKLAALALLLILLVACTEDEPLSESRIVLNVSVGTSYYPVTGTTTEAIFDSLGRSRLHDSDGAQAVGLTSAQLTYDWESKDRNSGDCAIGSMTLRFDLTMTLPQHTQEASLSPVIRDKWLEYAAGVKTHEQRHVTIYSDGGEVIRQAMLDIPQQSSCQKMDAEIARVWSEHYGIIDDQQDEFHVEEDIRVNALRQPVKQRIEAGSLRLGLLATEIARHERNIRTIESQAATMEGQLNLLKVRIEGLERTYPNGAPPGVLAQYHALVDEHNALIPRFNGLIAEGNEAIRQRNSLAEEHDKLVATLETLVEEYEWLR